MITVAALIEKLREYPLDAPVQATWEGVFRTVAVYRSRGGTVILDADNSSYRKRIEAGESFYTPDTDDA